MFNVSTFLSEVLIFLMHELYITQVKHGGVPLCFSDLWLNLKLIWLQEEEKRPQNISFDEGCYLCHYNPALWLKSYLDWCGVFWWTKSLSQVCEEKKFSLSCFAKPRIDQHSCPIYSLILHLILRCQYVFSLSVTWTKNVNVDFTSMYQHMLRMTVSDDQTENIIPAAEAKKMLTWNEEGLLLWRESWI